MAEADVLMFVVDALVGTHPSDYRIADMLRSSGKPWLLVANKADKPQSTDYFDLYNLGAGEPHPVSAVNGHGSGDLLDALIARLPEGRKTAEDALGIAVIGRPNVGKSSIVNRLLGEERLVVSDIPGSTRDAIDTPMRFHGRTFVFIDTAGIRRRTAQFTPGKCSRLWMMAQAHRDLFLAKFAVVATRASFADALREPTIVSRGRARSRRLKGREEARLFCGAWDN